MMDWSFLAYETQLTAKYYRPTGTFSLADSGRCEISNSQGQVFLTFRSENNMDGLGAFCKAMICCCVKHSIPEQSKKIGSHPSFGDVITSRMITHEFCCGNCSGKFTTLGSAHQIEGYYSGEQFLGAFQTLNPGCCTKEECLVLDANSNPFLSFTQTSTLVFRQGEEVACTIQSNLDQTTKGWFVVDTSGATATALLSAQLPIPIKLCLLMRTAEAAQQTYVASQKSSSGGGSS